ncbi:unnamed protein product, partial [Prunus brigantina]
FSRAGLVSLSFCVSVAIGELEGLGIGDCVRSAAKRVREGGREREREREFPFGVGYVVVNVKSRIVSTN